MSDSTTPSGMMKSLSAPGMEPDAKQRMLAELSRSVVEQAERMRRMEEDLRRREAEVARREQEGLKKSFMAADRVGAAEKVVHQEQRGIVEQKAHIEVERRLHEDAVARAKDEIQRVSGKIEEARKSVEGDRAKINKSFGELEAAREQYQNDRRELEKRFKEYQEANASVKRAVEDLQLKQHRYVKDREGFEKERVEQTAELEHLRARLEGREQRFEQARADFSGVAQQEERRLAQEKELERQESEKLEQLKRQIETERAMLRGEREILAQEKAALAAERKALEELRRASAEEKKPKPDSREAIDLPAGPSGAGGRRSSVPMREQRTGKTEAFSLGDILSISSPLESDSHATPKPMAKSSPPAPQGRPGPIAPPAAAMRPSGTLPQPAPAAAMRPSGGLPVASNGPKPPAALPQPIKGLSSPPQPSSSSDSGGLGSLAGLVAETMNSKKKSSDDIPVVSPEKSRPPAVKPPPAPLPAAAARPSQGSGMQGSLKPAPSPMVPAVKPAPPPVQADRPSASPAPVQRPSAAPAVRPAATPAAGSPPVQRASSVPSLRPQATPAAGSPPVPPPAIPSIPAASRPPVTAPVPASPIPSRVPTPEQLAAAYADGLSYEEILKTLEPDANAIPRLASDPMLAASAQTPPVVIPKAATPPPATPTLDADDEAMLKELEARLAEDTGDEDEAARVFEQEEAAAKPKPEAPKMPPPAPAMAAPSAQPTTDEIPSVAPEPEHIVEDLDEDLLRAIEDGEPEPEPLVEDPDEIQPMDEEPEPMEPEEIEPMEVDPIPGPKPKTGAIRTPTRAARRFGVPARPTSPLRHPRRPATPPHDLRKLKTHEETSNVVGMRVTGVDGVPDFEPQPPPEEDAPEGPRPGTVRGGPRRPPPR